MLRLHQKLIQPLEQKFDVAPLIDVQERLWPAPNNRQLSLTHPPSVTGGERYLHGNGTLKPGRREREFTEFVEELRGEYIYQVYQEVKVFARELGTGIGRVRFMLMPPVTCLSYHIDIEERDEGGQLTAHRLQPFRFHVPLYTNEKAFFVVDDRVGRMPEVGRLYALRTDCLHTAVNGSINEPRLHLVFCTYQLGDKYTTTN